MSNKCDVCGKHVSFGKKYARRGMARYLGGAGQKITGKTPRTFKANIQKIRVLTDTGAVKRQNVCTSCIKADKIRKATKSIPGRMVVAY